MIANDPRYEPLPVVEVLFLVGAAMLAIFSVRLTWNLWPDGGQVPLLFCACHLLPDQNVKTKSDLAAGPAATFCREPTRLNGRLRPVSPAPGSVSHVFGVYWMSNQPDSSLLSFAFQSFSFSVCFIVKNFKSNLAGFGWKLPDRRGPIIFKTVDLQDAGALTGATGAKCVRFA
ncbi:MAG: hypothetical protein P4N60_15715 [Verrucomicrobiae bacterium]|nr:hypothetical protein [Verrucomicrobiae bacterium]